MTTWPIVRTHDDRGKAWIFLGGTVVHKGSYATSLLVFASIVLTVLITGRQLWTTDLGMDEAMHDGRRIVTEVDRAGPAARANIAVGDEILKDPGEITFVPPWTEREIYAWNYRLHLAYEGGHVPMRLRRGDMVFDVDLVPPNAPTLPAAFRQLRRLGPHLPTSFAFLGVAALLVRRRRAASTDARAARLIAASCALFGPCWVIGRVAPAWPLWLFPVSSLLDVCAAAGGVLLLMWFAWSYPRRARVVDLSWVRAVLLVVGVVSAAYSVLNSMHVIEPFPHAHGNGPIIAYDSLLAMGVVAGLVWQRAHAETLVARRQATWLIVFSSVGLFVPILGLMVPEYVFGRPSMVLYSIIFPLPVLIPVGFALVIARYRLFALDGVARRAGPYAIALVTSLVAAIVGSLAVEDLVSDWNGRHDLSRWVGLGLAIVLTDPLRRGATRLLDLAFSRDRDAFLTRCTTLAARVARDADAGAIEAEVQRVLDARAAKLLSLADLVDVEAASAVGEVLAKQGTLRVVDLPLPAAVDLLHARGFELIVAGPSDEKLTSVPSVLALTLPVAAHDLGGPERDALALVGRIIGATLARDAARRALVEERSRAEDERRHIAMELHDSVGAALTAARMMTRRLRQPDGPAASGGQTLDTLDAMLTEGLADLRTSLWSLDAKVASWDDLTARIRRHVGDSGLVAGIETSVVVEGSPGRSLSPAIRLCILRVVQEGLSNALKHGSPSHVVVRLSATENGIALAVEDDGKGLPDTFVLGQGIGNMSRRVAASSGRFRIEPRESGGTRVSASVPIPVGPPQKAILPEGPST